MSTSRLLDSFASGEISPEAIQAGLSLGKPEDVAVLKAAANRMLVQNCGPEVYYRGLIEISNRCTKDCAYCGIRRSNRALPRFSMDKSEIVDRALAAARAGLGSVALQAGERNDAKFVDFVAEVVAEIGRATRSEKLPAGVGITLSLGEAEKSAYETWMAASANPQHMRYLLRFETSDEMLFEKLHAGAGPRKTLSGRFAALEALKEAGYQVGTGVMIGIPGQSLSSLARDILVFGEVGADMIGMGPYLASSGSAMPVPSPLPRARLLQLSLNMIAVTRLAYPSLNIAAATALQVLEDDARLEALSYGANVIMPNLTPSARRRAYTLYDGKGGLDDDFQAKLAQLNEGVHALGRRVAFDAYGASRHYLARTRGAKAPGAL